jgi:hypothetical protein
MVRPFKLRHSPVALRLRLPHPRRSRSAFAGRDSLRSVGHAANAGRKSLAMETSLGCLDLPHVSSLTTHACSLRVRVVSDWLPCHPARLQLDVHVSLLQFYHLWPTQALPTVSTVILPAALAFKLRTSHFQLPKTHPAKTFRWHRANGLQFQHYQQRKPSSRYERETLEHLPKLRRT